MLPWQEKLWQQMVNTPHPAHAYLLHGSKGIGKNLFAEHLAHYWLCLSPINKQPCGHCKSCHLLATSGAHPDIYHLVPEDSEFIKIDQVRGLVNFINQTPQLSSCKMVLIEPAEALNINAANALLKSLEEPAGNTRILLVSHQVGQLLATIRSRCIQLLFAKPTEQQAITWLQQQLPNLTAEQLAQLLALAGYTPFYALTLYEQGVLEQRHQVVEDIKKLLKQQVVASQVAEGWNKIPLLLLYDWFCEWLHAIIKYQLTQNTNQLGAADMAKVLGYLAEKVSFVKLNQLQTELLSERQKVLAKANLNRVLLLESVLIRWINLLTSR